MTNYKMVLLKDNKKEGKYKLNEELFNYNKKQLEPYISIPVPSKQVLCVETDEIFKNVHRAGKWVIKKRINGKLFR